MCQWGWGRLWTAWERSLGVCGSRATEGVLYKMWNYLGAYKNWATALTGKTRELRPDGLVRKVEGRSGLVQCSCSSGRPGLG